MDSPDSFRPPRSALFGARQIAVFGAGLIGVYVGGRLAAAGADVALIGRPYVLDDLRANGLHLTDLHGADIRLSPDRLRLTDDPAALADADLILLTVKSHATAAAAQDIARHARPGTVLLSLQNGVSNPERLRAALPALCVVAGMVPFNVVRPGPGHYHQGTGGDIAARDDPAFWPHAPLFAKAGLSLRLHSDMTPILWGKLVINLNNAINALSGLPLAAQLAERDYRRALSLSQREALRLLRRTRIAPARVLHIPTWLFPYLIALPDAVYRKLAARGGAPRIDRLARSSMADDLAQGRRTEIDDLNGEVVALARRLGRTAPINARIVELVHAAEAGAPPWAAAALLAELRRAR